MKQRGMDIFWNHTFPVPPLNNRIGSCISMHLSGYEARWKFGGTKDV